MGRPIRKSFFGNLNTPPIGGEGIATSITVANSGTYYSQGSVAVFSAPQLPGGSTAAGTLTIFTPANGGGITAVTRTSAGSGYSSTATITITTATGVSKATTGTASSTSIFPANTTGIFVGMQVIGTGINASPTYVATVNTNSLVLTLANASTVTGTVNFIDIGSGFAAVTSLTSVKDNAISVTAFVPGGSSAVAGDIVKQESSRRYLVTTAQGTGQCILVTTNSPSAGQMYIVATDVNGSTYWVKKLTARRAVLTRRSMTGSYEYATGAAAGWSLNAATTGTVKISNA